MYNKNEELNKHHNKICCMHNYFAILKDFILKRQKNSVNYAIFI